MANMVLSNNFYFNNELNETMRFWQDFCKLNNIFTSTLTICLKRKVFDQCILPILTYGSETLRLSIRPEKKTEPHKALCKGWYWHPFVRQEEKFINKWTNESMCC